MSRMVTVNVDVDVDLEDVSTDDLIDELEERGIETGPSLKEALENSLVLAWLRNSNPPQEIRDAYFATFGRMLL